MDYALLNRRMVTKCKLSNKRVILRVDFNVPIKNGRILNDYRLRQHLTTIKYILSKNPKKLILISHLGRPKKPDKAFSLLPVKRRLEKLLNRKIDFKTLDGEISNPSKKKIVLLENIRFYKEEVTNDRKFCNKIATIGDIFVNDAFSVMHRKHCSTYGLATLLPTYIGFLVRDEIKNLDFKKVKKPLIVILGGAKLSTKLKLIKKLLRISDKLLLGGAMIFTFYKSHGFNVGKSLVEEDLTEEAKKLWNNKKLILPIDVLCSKSIKKPVRIKNKYINELTNNDYGVDIGINTIKEYCRIINEANTVFWNGPLGIYEIKEFSKGSIMIAKCIAKSKAKKIAGGGDTVAIIEKLKLKYDFISTGGGATLDYIANQTLPFFELIKKK